VVPVPTAIRTAAPWSRHVRLAIIDLSPGGHQPLAGPDGAVWITYNGEIFNYIELRSELAARGHVFRSASDTEVLATAGSSGERGSSRA